jgi:hypothetical protein
MKKDTFNRQASKLQQLFCKHSYEKVDWFEKYDSVYNVRHSVRVYVCSKCGKRLVVDGRYDNVRA